MPDPSEDLEAALAGLPPETQRAAMKVLVEWGNSPLGHDSFPVRMALVVRLQLWALSRSAAKLAGERLAISELVTGVSMALAREGEIRQAFLRDLRAEERSLAQRLISLAAVIEKQQGFLLARLDELTTALAVASQAREVSLRPSNLPTVPSPRRQPSRQATARLLRLLRRLEPAVAAWSPPEAPTTATVTSHDIDPELAVPSGLGRENKRQRLLGRWVTIFLAALAYAWVINVDVNHRTDALIRAAPAAVGFATICVCFLPARTSIGQ